jgi:dUTP pyrophosphatase
MSEPLEIKVKKLCPEAVIPTYSTEGAAGMDVTAVNINGTERYIEYGTGLSFEIPKEYVLLIFPRSGVSNKDLMLKNCVGILDSDYRGELKLRFQRFGSEEYKVGEKCGQIMIIPYPKIKFREVQELSETQRGDGGFGSTGK